MDWELRAAREKLAKEQRERKERARLMLERDRRVKAEAARQREAIEASQRERRVALAIEREQAELHMEEARELGNGILFLQICEALPYDGPGDKIKLPPSSFDQLSSQGAFDEGPLYFRLSIVCEVAGPNSSNTFGSSNTAAERTPMIHCGVLEFTAREGSAELPPHVWSNLFHESVPEVPLIVVQFVRLPKGTYAKLRPETLGFADLPNHKAVLETALRNHATLSEGEVVTVSYGNLRYNLKVLELKPASAVSVLETDVDVDIDQCNAVVDGEVDTEHVLVPLSIGKAESGVVEEGRFKYYKFFIDDRVGETVSSGKANIEVKIDADIGSGDADIYVSRHPMVFPTQHCHEWSSHEMGSKLLIVKPKDPRIVAGTYSIGVFGFKGQTSFNICVGIRNIGEEKVGEKTIKYDVDNNSRLCGNCRRHIPIHTAVVHEAYCIRHNVFCQHEGCGVVLRKEEAVNHVHCSKCQRAFQQGEMEKHMKVFHEPILCHCGVRLEKEDMVRHQSASCPQRLIVCRFCGDMVPAGSEPSDPRDRLRGLCEHESLCGSRTAPCDSCGRSVMLKDMEVHVFAVHQKS